MLEVQGLVKSYGTLRAVDGLSLTVAPGEVYGLLGPNGAGKTTTLRVILGFLRPDAGGARVMGIDVARDPVAARAAIGYLPGDVRLDPGTTGGELLAFLGRFRPDVGRSFRDALAARFQLDLAKPVKAYSKGNRQKLAITAALQGRPRVAILDEPTSGLDPLMQREFNALIAELAAGGTAILFSSHVLAEVQQVCRRVGVLREGRLVMDKPIADLEREVVRRVEVVFDGPAPPDAELALAGAARIERHGDRVRFVLQKSPDELIKALARFGVRDLVFERPDLEDLFLSHYAS